MDSYSALRQFADSWWLLVMFGFFVLVVLWTFRPGSRKTHDDIASIPLRDDDLSRLSESAEGEDGADDGAAPRPNEDQTRSERPIPKET